LITGTGIYQNKEIYHRDLHEACLLEDVLYQVCKVSISQKKDRKKHHLNAYFYPSEIRYLTKKL
jgi:hypothetical protein